MLCENVANQILKRQISTSITNWEKQGPLYTFREILLNETIFIIALTSLLFN